MTIRTIITCVAILSALAIAVILFCITHSPPPMTPQEKAARSAAFKASLQHQYSSVRQKR